MQDRGAEGSVDLLKWSARQPQRRELFWGKASERSQEAQPIAAERCTFTMVHAVDPARALIPAERLSLLRWAPAINAVIKFWCMPRSVKERELTPTCDKDVWETRLEQIPCAQQQRIQFGLGLLFTRGSLHELCCVPRNGTTQQSATKSEPDALWLHLGHHVKGAPRRERDLELCERFHATAETAGRLSHPLGDRLELSAIRRDEGEHAIGLAEAETRGHNCQRPRGSAFRHGERVALEHDVTPWHPDWGEPS